MDTAVITVASLLTGGLGLSIYLVAADPRRFFAQYTLEDWNARQYQSMVSNYLQALHDEGLPIWPKKLNGLTAAWYGMRVRKIIKRRPSLKKSRFLHSHLNLAALLTMLKPFIDDQILARRINLIVSRIVDMGDTADRDRLSDFVERAENVRTQFQRRLTPIDKHIQAHLQMIHFVTTLEHLHAIFLEHGFCLLPQLDDLRRWDGMEGCELAQDLPILSNPKELQTWTGLVPHIDTLM